jgi:8-amino-7-oxononanoate synthase
LRAVAEFMEIAAAANAMPEVRVIHGASTEPVVTVDGREVLLFCSSNYLGLATHPEIKQAVIEAVQEYGLGANGSRLVSGTTDLHLALEEATADYKGTEAAIAFSTGFMANTGTIPALAYVPYFARMAGLPLHSETQEMVILSDALNHASVVEGCRAARARHSHYPHCDLDALDNKLRHNWDKRLLIVTDGVFSMDGDIAPLPGILALAEEYGATLLLDDAHATGVLGSGGGGTLEHFGLEGGGNVLQMGTYSKAFGALGGFVAADQQTVEYLRVAAGAYMFSGALPPCLAAGILKAMEIAQREPQRRVKLWRNRDYVVGSLGDLGFDTLGSETPIVPLLIGDDETAAAISSELFERGIFAPSVRWPAVARGQSRVRIALMASHERSHLDRLIEALADLGAKYGVV